MSFKLSSISFALISSIAAFQVSYAETYQTKNGNITVDHGNIGSESDLDLIALFAKSGYKLEVIDTNINVMAKNNGGKASGNGSQLIVGTEDTSATSITSYRTTSSNNKSASVYAEKNGLIKIYGNSISLISTSSKSKPAYGVYAESGKVQLGSSNTKTITIENSGNSNSPSDGYESAGIMASTAGTSVNVTTNTLTINSSGVGLFVHSNTDEENAPENSASIQINSNHTTINATDTGIRAFSNGQVTITGGVKIDAPTAFDVRGNSTTKINTNKTGTVKIDGDIAFETPGAAQSSGNKINANVEIYMSGEDSYWRGNAYKHYASSVGSDQNNTTVKGFKLTLADGAQWTPTLITESVGGETILEEQSLNDLTFNGGVINLVEDGAQSVSIDNTSGTGGKIKLHTTVSDDGQMTAGTVDFGTGDVADMEFAVEYTGITADDIKDGSLSAIEGGIKGGENATLAHTKTVQQGAVLGAITETYDALGKLVSREQGANTRLTAYGSVASLGILQWRHDMNDLTKRMGELRSSSEGVGSWARLYGSEQEYGAQGIASKNTSIQVGADFDVGAGWKVGAAFTYTDGDARYDLGNADSKAYGLAVYGTWFADNGQFVDLIAKYSRLDTDFNLEGMDGSFDNNAYSVSAEYGWHLKLGDFAFVEPQVELTYGMVSGDDFTTGNAVRIEQDDFDSLIGRVGFRTGFVFPENKGTIYARASVLHDFQGEMDSKASLVSDSSVSNPVNDDLGGTWYEFGVGANFNLTARTYTYVDLEKNTGGEVKENWRWNIGLRHTF